MINLIQPRRETISEYNVHFKVKKLPNDVLCDHINNYQEHLNYLGYPESTQEEVIRMIYNIDNFSYMYLVVEYNDYYYFIEDPLYFSAQRYSFCGD